MASDPALRDRIQKAVEEKGSSVEAVSLSSLMFKLGMSDVKASAFRRALWSLNARKVIFVERTDDRDAMGARGYIVHPRAGSVGRSTENMSVGVA